MAGAAGFIAVWLSLPLLLRALLQVPALAPHAANIFFALFVLNGVFAMIWAMNTIFIAQNEALKR
jgi:hypothetical protein